MSTVGDDETPGSVSPVDLGPGVTVTAITAGAFHTCALLTDATVRCWGFGGEGRLGYANTDTIGDDETPGMVSPVELGPGRAARAISAGDSHTCGLLDDGSVRCWGLGSDGRLGYASTNDVGDDEIPGGVGPVDLGPGRAAVAVSAGASSTCARLDDGSVRCWGAGAHGRLGYCSTVTIGDDESPGSAGPVDLGVPANPGVGCATPTPPSVPGPTMPVLSPPPLPGGPPPPTAPDETVAALAAEKLRAAALRRCLRSASRAPRRQRRRARRRCLTRHGRTPGRVSSLAVTATGRTTIRLSFRAVGTDNAKPPAARGNLVKQSRRPIKTARDVVRADALCGGLCRFSVSAVGTKLALTVKQLRSKRTYHYVIVARDNVSARPGRRSRSVSARTF